MWETDVTDRLSGAHKAEDSRYTRRRETTPSTYPTSFPVSLLAITRTNSPLGRFPGRSGSGKPTTVRTVTARGAHCIGTWRMSSGWVRWTRLRWGLRYPCLLERKRRRRRRRPFLFEFLVSCSSLRTRKEGERRGKRGERVLSGFGVISACWSGFGLEVCVVWFGGDWGFVELKGFVGFGDWVLVDFSGVFVFLNFFFLGFWLFFCLILGWWWFDLVWGVGCVGRVLIWLLEVRGFLVLIEFGLWVGDLKGVFRAGRDLSVEFCRNSGFFVCDLCLFRVLGWWGLGSLEFRSICLEISRGWEIWVLKREMTSTEAPARVNGGNGRESHPSGGSAPEGGGYDAGRGFGAGMGGRGRVLLNIHRRLWKEHLIFPFLFSFSSNLERNFFEYNLFSCFRIGWCSL